MMHPCFRRFEIATRYLAQELDGRYRAGNIADASNLELLCVIQVVQARHIPAAARTVRIPLP